MSSFVWIDHSEKQRRQVLEAIDLFREKDTRDELGISRVRDAISDALFPGTGALQTRARYFFFVPWMYQQFESKRTPPADLARKVREFEIRLIDILADSPDPTGTIGIQARKSLQRFPSSIYWNGLKVLKIAAGQGSVADYYRNVERSRNAKSAALIDDDGETVQGRRSVWDPNLPKAPASFPDKADFVLTKHEAAYLKERLLTHHPRSLFAFFLNEGVNDSNYDFGWDQPSIDRASAVLRRQVELSRIFSEVMHGAAILYNRALADMEPRRVEVLERCDEMLTAWQELLDDRRTALNGFDAEEFWRMVREFGMVPTTPTRLFVDSWFTIALNRSRRQAVAADTQARELIFARERQTKGALARCDNARVREMWQGVAGLGRLDYRWKNAEVILNDIATGVARHA
jgi:hypothetical protein